MGLAPVLVSALYETVGELARSGLSILVAEQFAQTVLPLARSAAIMLQGRIVRVGDPSEIEEELASAYLGG
jgi:branched-chain amino acid transport system ATP-binding protein